MDYKFRQVGITVTVLFVVTVICVVIAVNRSTIQRRSESGKTVGQETAVSESVTVEEKEDTSLFFNGTRIGEDLYSWKYDPAFFDAGEKEKVEERIEVEKIPLNKRRKLYLNEEEK